jgi:hypothetical protein
VWIIVGVVLAIYLLPLIVVAVQVAENKTGSFGQMVSSIGG